MGKIAEILIKIYIFLQTIAIFVLNRIRFNIYVMYGKAKSPLTTCFKFNMSPTLQSVKYQMLLLCKINF